MSELQCPTRGDTLAKRAADPPALPGRPDEYLVCPISFSGYSEPVTFPAGTAEYKALDVRLAMTDGKGDDNCADYGEARRWVFARVGGGIFAVRLPVDGCGHYGPGLPEAVDAAYDLVPVDVRMSIALDQPDATVIVTAGQTLELTAPPRIDLAPTRDLVGLVRDRSTDAVTSQLLYAARPGVEVITARPLDEPDRPAVRVLRIRVRPSS